jgi:hypothetical protein
MIVIYSSVRNETRILEWVNYYLQLGIGHIILFDDNDFEDDSLYKSLISVNSSVLSIIKDNSRTNLERIKTNYHHSNENWLHLKHILTNLKATYIFKIDCDEFLYLNKFATIQEMVAFYEPFDAILINWLIFGGTYLQLNEQLTVTNVFTKSNKLLHFHVKSLAKITSIINFNNNAHTFKLMNNSIIKDIDNNIIANFNQDSNHSLQLTSHNLPNMNYKNRIYLAHYMCQDYYTYIKRKFLDNMAQVYFSYAFFNHIPAEDKLHFKEYFLKDIDLSLGYMQMLHMAKIHNTEVVLHKTEFKGRFNAPYKRKLRPMLDAVFTYYYYIDEDSNKTTNTDIILSLSNRRIQKFLHHP